jgi:uncharacterized membrane protein YedE/YeeE
VPARERSGRPARPAPLLGAQQPLLLWKQREQREQREQRAARRPATSTIINHCLSNHQPVNYPEMHDFTPVHALAGGALIGLALAFMLIGTGRIAGLSDVVAGLVRPAADGTWRAWFVAGTLLVGAGFAIAAPRTYDAGARGPLWLIGLSGALVGFGTRLANGCTSGHGLCGVSRGSARSIVATATFFAVGVATATLSGHLVRQP